MRALLPLLALALLPGCNKAQGRSERVSTPYAATAVGRIDAAEEARHLVASVNGVIDELLVARGERVGVGQALLRVKCDTQVRQVGANAALASQARAAVSKLRASQREQEVAAADAAIRQAEANLNEQAQRLTVAEGLQEKGFISAREIGARTNSRDSAAAELSAAQARRAMLNDSERRPELAEASAAARAARAETAVAIAAADQCVLRSPVAGNVLQILRQEGEFSGASQGTPLIIVGDLGRMIARAEINERDALAVREGQRAQIWVDGRKERWTGIVAHLASVMGRRTARSLDPTDRFDRDTREVFIAFDGAPPPALVGLRVTVGLLK
jgi:multidrug resistance efflux pump